MHILFKTPIGSRLYGLSHANSDYDYYTVVDRVKKNKATYSKHKIVDGVDSVVVDFGTWINLCQSNVPQALEAMFSQVPEHDEIAEFRAAFVAGTNYDKYMRTIKALAFHEPTDMKHRRHALRLAYNLYQMRKDGRFNPTLSFLRAKVYTSLAQDLDSQGCYSTALDIAWG